MLRPAEGRFVPDTLSAAATPIGESGFAACATSWRLRGFA
jgi:hypothetical protein